MSSPIHDKIKKMFALANDKGASEDEAATAMRLAMGLMAKYGIEQADLKDIEQPRTKRGAIMKFKFEKHQVVIANAAAYLYGCRIIFYDMGKGGMQIVGRPENIDATEATMTFLFRQVEQLYKDNLPSGMTQQMRSQYRKTFKFACAVRVEQRAYDLWREMCENETAARAATGKNALVVANHFKQLVLEADANMEGDIKRKTIRQSCGIGTNDGTAAGDKVKLRQELNETKKVAHG